MVTLWSEKEPSHLRPFEGRISSNKWNCKSEAAFRKGINEVVNLNLYFINYESLHKLTWRDYNYFFCFGNIFLKFQWWLCYNIRREYQLIAHLNIVKQTSFINEINNWSQHVIKWGWIKFKIRIWYWCLRFPCFYFIWKKQFSKKKIIRADKSHLVKTLK